MMMLVSELIDVCAALYEVYPAQVRKDLRARPRHARQLAVYFAQVLSGYTPARTGRAFGMDRSTTYSAVAAVKERFTPAELADVADEVMACVAARRPPVNRVINFVTHPIRLAELKRKTRPRTFVFDPEKDVLIQEHYCSMHLEDLCDLLDIDEAPRVVARAAELRKRTGKPAYIDKIRRVHPMFYSTRDEQFMLQNIPKLGIAVVAERLGRGVDGVRKKYLALRKAAGLTRARRAMPDQTLKFIKANWPAMSQIELAIATGSTVGQIAGKLHRLRAGGHACLKKETTRYDTPKGARRLNRGAGHVLPSGGGQRSPSLQAVSINAQRS
jgi:hypothetical protein